MHGSASRGRSPEAGVPAIQGVAGQAPEAGCGFDQPLVTKPVHKHLGAVQKRRDSAGDFVRRTFCARQQDPEELAADRRCL